MSVIEDAVRDAMRRGDADAPTTAEFRFRTPADVPPTRRRWIAVAAAAACVAAVAAVAVGITSRHHHRSLAVAPPPPAVAALRCPAARPAENDHYPLPAPRADALDVPDRLVPKVVPVRAVVCAYARPNPAVLAGSRVIDGGLSRIPDALGWLPPQLGQRPCTAQLEMTDGDLYLLGLSYPNGTLWVSAPGYHCSGASNGSFEVDAHVASLAISAYRDGTWPADTVGAGAGACSAGAGRLGQEIAMVPATPTSVEVCRADSLPASRTGTRGDLSALVTALNSQPTQRDSYAFSCGSRGSPEASYRVIFGYATGPPVQVDVEQGCRPAVHNGSLQTDDASGVLSLIRQILAR